jgi:hypothetical protein
MYTFIPTIPAKQIPTNCLYNKLINYNPRIRSNEGNQEIQSIIFNMKGCDKEI